MAAGAGLTMLPGVEHAALQKTGREGGRDVYEFATKRHLGKFFVLNPGLDPKVAKCFIAMENAFARQQRAEAFDLSYVPIGSFHNCVAVIKDADFEITQEALSALGMKLVHSRDLNLTHGSTKAQIKMNGIAHAYVVKQDPDQPPLSSRDFGEKYQLELTFAMQQLNFR